LLAGPAGDDNRGREAGRAFGAAQIFVSAMIIATTTKTTIATCV
jgi:hypothetical protein